MAFSLCRRWSIPLEVLACPHCDRLFQVAPGALGKKIRCRGCREIFHLPRDTSSVPVGPSPAVPSREASLPPLAVPCVIDGQDARQCPQCGRVFGMQDSLAGKTIRCRGCAATFRVAATAPGQPSPLTPPQPAPRPDSPPRIFKDIGDVLGEPAPGEAVASVTRPRSLPRVPAPSSSPVATMIAVVLGGACALPAALVILRFISRERFEEVAAVLPKFLGEWLR